MRILKPFVLACYDTSLGAGRLSANWVPTLNAQIRDFPEARGPVVVLNMGHGGWTSNDLLAGVGDVVALKPTHILTEGGAINDCFDGGSGPVISRATHNANNLAMLNAMMAGIPGVDLTVMTMSSVSASQTGRSQLGVYYSDEIATANSLGLRVLDNYSGWPKPLDGTKTYGAAPFALPISAGFISPGGGATWNPADKAAAITLSFDDLTATSIGGSGAVRSTAPITGNAHFEMSWTTGPPLMGIANSSFPVGSTLGGDANSIAVSNTGNVTHNGGSVGFAGFTSASGDPNGFEVDRTANLIYFLHGTSRSAGFSIAGISGDIYPAFGTSLGSATLHQSNEGDGLHPTWLGAVDTYLFPNIVALARRLMAAWWP